MEALLSRVQGMLREREAASPALGLARDLGLGELATFWLEASLNSEELNANGVPLYQGQASIDSRWPTWFFVSVSRVDVESSARSPETRFDVAQVHADTLGLGRCSAAELPRWAREAAGTLGVTWRLVRLLPGTNVRGARRERLARWLRGEG